MDFDSEDIQKTFLDLIRPWDAELKGSLVVPPVPPLVSPKSDGSESASIVPPIREKFTPNSGDIPAVQERFEALLKSRLSLEIEQNLPLFPWEDEVLEYQSDRVDSPGMADNVASGLNKSGSLWLAQLRRLAIPVALPETMLTSLLSACESIVQTSLREGVKVVKVAESFFPENFLQLNELAGIVMMSRP